MQYIESIQGWIGGDLCKGCAALKAQMVIQVLHPLEVIRTRLQSEDWRGERGYMNSGMKACRVIWKQEGLGGLFRGAPFTLLANSSAQFLFFLLYNLLRHELSTLAASVTSGVLVVVITQPFWTLKTRLLLSHQTLPLFSLIQQIQQQHSWLGFYRGFLASLLLCSNAVIQLNIYECLDTLIHPTNHNHIHNNINNNINNNNNWFGQPLKQLAFVNGAVSKVMATLVTYPLVTVRTRWQQNQYSNNNNNNNNNNIQKQQQKYTSYSDIVSKTLKYEGMAGFYKGIYPSLLRTVPNQGIFFFLYEFFKNNVDQCVN